MTTEDREADAQPTPGATPPPQEPVSPPGDSGTPPEGPASEEHHNDDSNDQESSDNLPFLDMLPPAGRKSIVADSVRAQASFIGDTHIHSVSISSNQGRYRIPLTDLSALHTRATFVPPPGYQGLVQALASQRVVVCCGPNGCGKELAVTRALEQVGQKTIRLLPASLSLAEMSRVINTEIDDGGAFVLPALSDSWLRSLVGSPGQSIRASASSGRITVVAVTATEPRKSLGRQFEVVTLGYPNASVVLAEYAAALGAPDSVREMATQALEQLAPPVSPAVIEALLAEAIARPEGSATEIASSFTNAVSAEAISQWIAEGREPGEVAMLAAGATLSGAPDAVVHEQADRLRARLEPTGHRDQPQQLITAGSAWPAGLLQPAVENMNTHFGIQPFHIIEVAAPHRPQDVVRAMWQTLGLSFRSEYCDWLVDLPSFRGLSWHASYTAGVLLTIDPVLIEAKVLRRWLGSELPTLRRCAGLALGAPMAIGSDPATARRLAHAWATSDSTRLRQAAIAAYGGLLGAWDTASAAPLKLFVLGQLTPELRHEADRAIASLVVAGAEAVSARSAVISYLKLTLVDRASKPRMFGCLPVIVRALVQPDGLCMESLAALQAEPDSWRGFARLMATAMIEPAGLTAGQDCLALLVRAGALGIVDHDVIEKAIREMKESMKESQRPAGTIERLGSAIKRTLKAMTRSDDEDIAATASELLSQFFD